MGQRVMPMSMDQACRDAPQLRARQTTRGCERTKDEICHRDESERADEAHRKWHSEQLVVKTDGAVAPRQEVTCFAYRQTGAGVWGCRERSCQREHERAHRKADCGRERGTSSDRLVSHVKRCAAPPEQGRDSCTEEGFLDVEPFE